MLRPHLLALCVALGAGLAGSSCSKNAQELPGPVAPTVKPSAPGVITGLVQPADALVGLSVFDNEANQTVNIDAVVDFRTGAYSLGAVPVGTYTLYFNTKPGYVSPRQQIVTVTAGKTTVVPTVMAMRSTAAFKVDGLAFTPPYIDLSLGFDGKAFPLSSCFSIVLSDGLGFVPNTGTYILFLTMPYAVQVGTYPLDGALTYAIFKDTKAGSFDSRLNPSTIPSGGVLTITAVDNTAPFPRSVSGTFSFTGTDATLGTQRTISGTFANAIF